MIMEINKAEESFKAKLSTRLIEAEEKGYSESYREGYREGYWITVNKVDTKREGT